MIFLASQIVQPEIVQGSCQCGFSCLVSQLGVKDFSRCWFLSPGSSYCERQGHVNATLTFPPCLLPPTIPFDLGKDSLVGFSKTLKVVSASATLFKTELSMLCYVMLCYVMLIFFFFSGHHLCFVGLNYSHGQSNDSLLGANILPLEN